MKSPFRGELAEAILRVVGRLESSTHIAARTSRTQRRLNGTIVCVIDDLESANAALQVARRLADRFDARILLVSITPGAQARFGVVDEEQRVAAGDPVEAVARIATDEAADLIVLGSRRGLRAGTLRSSLADDLAATARCPVVVAPPPQLGR